MKAIYRLGLGWVPAIFFFSDFTLQIFVEGHIVFFFVFVPLPGLRNKKPTGIDRVATCFFSSHCTWVASHRVHTCVVLFCAFSRVVFLPLWCFSRIPAISSGIT